MPTDTAARHAQPMDTTNTTRIARSAAAAALVAAALVGCAAQASAPVDPLEGPVGALEPRRLVSNDIDPRGLHGPQALSQQTRAAQRMQRMPVIADIDPRGRHGVPNGAATPPLEEVHAAAPPRNLSPVNDVDPRGLHGLPSGSQ